MPWSISPGGTFAATGVTRCTRSLQAGGRSTCEITLARDLSAASLYAEDDAVTVTGPGGIFFTGVVDRPARAATGGSHGHTVTLVTKWKWLEEIPYTQPFASGSSSTAIRKSSVVLGLADNGARQTTQQILFAILGFANTQGAGITIGSILPGVTLTPPTMQMADVTCAEAIRAVLRWHPDAVLSFTPAGVINIERPGGMTAVSRAVGGAAGTSRCAVWPRQGMGLRGVVVHYEITTTVDGVDYLQIVDDTAGAVTGRRVAHFTIPLRGASIITQQQEIETLDIPDGIGELGPWLKKKFPEIADGNPEAGDLTIHSFTQEVAADEKTGPGGALENYPRELIKGSIQPWMSGVSAAPVRITINIEFTGSAATKPKLARLFNNLSRREDFYVELTGTDAEDQTYRTAGGSGGEEVPEGLADAFFEAFQSVPDEGEYTSTAADPDVGIYPGMALSLTGSATVTGSPVQSTVTDALTGTTTVRFGPMNQALSPSGFLEVLRAGQRQHPLVNPGGGIRTDAASGAAGNTVHGATGSRWKNTGRSYTPEGGPTPWLCARTAPLTLRVYPALILDGLGNMVWCVYDGVDAEAEAYFDIALPASAGSGWLYLRCEVDDSNDLHGIITSAELLLTGTEPDFYQRSGSHVNIPVCVVDVGPVTYTMEALIAFLFVLRRYGPPGSETWDVQPRG
ncbi:MAG: hypothetical protein V4726_00810 [Verrucomicrobiota bacterium]